MWAIFKRNGDVVRTGIKTEKGAKKIACIRGHAVVGYILENKRVVKVQRKIKFLSSQSWCYVPQEESRFQFEV